MLVSFWNGVFDVSSSMGILLLLPGTTLTTLGGVVSSLEFDYSDEEDLYLLMATLGVPDPPSCSVAFRRLLPLLWSLSTFTVFLLLPPPFNPPVLPELFLPLH